MSFILRCYTLFDITYTGILNRNKYKNDESKEWVYKRNTQCNFDTILQVISLRSQPEVMVYPTFTVQKLHKRFDFGSKYRGSKSYNVWQFDFNIMHTAVFQNDHSELGLLHEDCNNVPMIVCHTMNNDVISFLDTTPQYKNIYFEVINNEQ